MTNTYTFLSNLFTFGVEITYVFNVLPLPAYERIVRNIVWRLTLRTKICSQKTLPSHTIH